MSLNFPADPNANPIYEAPNGVTYIWNDSIQSWVVQSVSYDNDYVNRIGDTMSGNLNFQANQLGISWGGNPRLQFMPGGNAELRGNYVVTGGFKFTSNGINFTNADTLLKFNNSTRFRFTSDITAFAYGGSQMMTVSNNGVQYFGNFAQDKNVVTVEYVTTEVTDLQGQIDNITNDLDTIIEDIVDQKAVLLTGNQTASGTKTFTGEVLLKGVPGNVTGNDSSFKFRVADSNLNRFLWVSTDGRVHIQTNETFANDIFPPLDTNTQVVHKKYVDSKFLTGVTGTSGDNDDTGVRTNAKSNGVQKIYMMKATKDQYGVNVRGLLPQGNNTPANADLKVGQMFFNTSTKRVHIRVN